MTLLEAVKMVAEVSAFCVASFTLIYLAILFLAQLIHQIVVCILK